MKTSSGPGGIDISRVRKELKDVANQLGTTGVTAECVGDDLTHLKGKLKGPSGSPYEGGIFVVDMKLPYAYPFEPPKCSFVSKIWHPNISSQTGAICLDILKDQWSPALNVKTVLLSLQALLSTPDPNDPQDAEVARQYLTDYQGWRSTAKFWTEAYARPSDDSARTAMVRSFMDMGLGDEAKCRAALEASNWDETKAVDRLMNMG